MKIIVTYLFISILFFFVYIYVDFRKYDLPLSEYVKQEDDSDVMLRIIIFGLAWPIIILFFLIVILNNIRQRILCLIYLCSIKKILKKLNKTSVNLKKKGERKHE